MRRPGLLYYPSATRERKIVAPHESVESSILVLLFLSSMSGGRGLKHDVAEWSDFCKAFCSMSKLIITLIHADYCQEFFVLIYEDPAAPFSHQRMSSTVLSDRMVSTQHLLVYNTTREIMFSECKLTFSEVFFVRGKGMTNSSPRSVFSTSNVHYLLCLLSPPMNMKR